MDDWITALTNVKALVIPTGAEETVNGDKLQTVMVYAILVDNDVDGITPEQRVLWNGLELYIRGVVPEIENNGVQVIYASEEKKRAT